MNDTSDNTRNTETYFTAILRITNDQRNTEGQIRLAIAKQWILESHLIHSRFGWEITVSPYTLTIGPKMFAMWRITITGAGPAPNSDKKNELSEWLRRSTEAIKRLMKARNIQHGEIRHTRIEAIYYLEAEMKQAT